MSQAARLLVVTPRFFPYMGGVENHVYQVTRRLAARGLEVTVLTTDPRRTLPAEEIIAGVRVVRVPSWPGREDIFFAPQIYTHIRRGRYSMVHIQSYHTLVAPLAMLAAWRAGIPYLLTFHGGGSSSAWRNRLRGLHRRLLRPLLARAARLVATARFEITEYSRELNLPVERFALSPNGSDLPPPGPGCAPGPGYAPDPGYAPGRPPGLIASLGRLEKYKGHQRILAAMPAILKHAPHARLWIAGSGPYQAELERQAERLGVAGQVEIRSVPAADREEWAARLRTVSLAVLLSEFETHPMALLEALACGCPALVADTSGLSELAENGWAASLPLDSPPELVAACALELLAHPAGLLTDRPPLPTWEACAAGLLDLYCQASPGLLPGLPGPHDYERAGA